MAHSAHILLVDDYELNQELLEAYLLHSGLPLVIHRASCCAEAYQCIERQDLDLILLDVMLPDGSGYDVCRFLKNHPFYQNIPVVILTALHDKQNMLQGLQAGADEFLTKPVDSHELLLRVKNLLQMKSIANDLDARYNQLHQELVMATELQKSFLPRAVPQRDGVEIEVLYKPCSLIGGDFYDFLEIDDGRLGILICDVKGHGVASAMITAAIKGQLYDLKEHYLEPDQLLGRLNQQLERFFSSTANDYFVTAFYGVLDLAQNTFCYSSAGHSWPCLCRADGLRFLENQQGLPLGILPEVTYDRQMVWLAAGDELFFYTDGIFSLSLRGKPEKSCSGLLDFFAGEAPPTVREIRQLQQEIRRYADGQQITDDINYIAVRL